MASRDEAADRKALCERLIDDTFFDALKAMIGDSDTHYLDGKCKSNYNDEVMSALLARGRHNAVMEILNQLDVLREESVENREVID